VSEAAGAGQGAGLTVAVTGPTGEIGRSVIRALEEAPEVGRIVGMARRPFDPAEHGWTRTEYRRGDVLDRSSVDSLVAEADVVVHLAFIIFGGHEETREVNLRGSRNVFEAAVAAGAGRLVYTSSVAAYGFHADNPDLLSEEIEPRGTDSFYYSAQKAELEATLEDATRGADTDVYVFRPCIVAGRDAPMLVSATVDAVSLGGRFGFVRRALRNVPLLRPVLPDPGVPFQLVHHDDVATAIRAAVLGAGPPGVYNLAAEGTLTMSDLAAALGWRSVPVPRAAVGGLAELVARAPLMPARVSWLHAARRPVVMDCSKARGELGWAPRRDSAETLADTVAGARESGLLA
jgi:nucleoside-diphosphate-sugar epimerase